MIRIWDFLYKRKIILLILLLAAALRFYDINNNPRAMYGDSLTLVYDAYSILKTGHDQTGQFLPLYFSMGGGRPGGYIYATIPFVAIFGPTALAARSVSILSGVGVVLLLYLICAQVLTRRIGLWAAFFAAITPWELSLSRGAFESHFALFLGLLGLYLFCKSKEDKWLLILSGLSFGLCIQTYSSYVLTIPLFVLILLLGKGGSFKRIFLNLPLLLFLALISGSLFFSIYISYSRGSKDRFSNLLIFNQPEIQNYISSKVKVERAYSLLKPELVKKIHNSTWENMSVLMDNYIKSFGLEFLFLKGDKNPRHNPAAMGELYWISLPLIILGCVYLFLKNRKLFYFLALWIVISPIAATLVGPAHALRSSFLLPPLLILSACGVEKARMLKVLLIILMIIQLPIFVERFYLLSPRLYASFWSYSAKKAAQTAINSKSEYNYIILSTSIPDMEYAYPVYAQIDPAQVINQNSQKSFIKEYSFSKYDNVYLGSIPVANIKKIMDSLNGSVLYLGPIEDIGKLDNEGIQRDEAEKPLFASSTKDR